jgi:hypothetical protein
MAPEWDTHDSVINFYYYVHILNDPYMSSWKPKWTTNLDVGILWVVRIGLVFFFFST